MTRLPGASIKQPVQVCHPYSWVAALYSVNQTRNEHRSNPIERRPKILRGCQSEPGGPPAPEQAARGSGTTALQELRATRGDMALMPRQEPHLGKLHFIASHACGLENYSYQALFFGSTLGQRLTLTTPKLYSCGLQATRAQHCSPWSCGAPPPPQPERWGPLHFGEKATAEAGGAGCRDASLPCHL